MGDQFHLEQLDSADAAKRLADTREGAAMASTAFDLMSALSPRQREVVACMRSGLTMTQTATVMRVARGTTYGYWRRVRRKIAELAKKTAASGAAEPNES